LLLGGDLVTNYTTIFDLTILIVGKLQHFLVSTLQNFKKFKLLTGCMQQLGSFARTCSPTFKGDLRSGGLAEIMVTLGEPCQEMSTLLAGYIPQRHP
jgi:hypothetical protein